MKFSGLANIGNTCYLNSVIQSLYNCDDLYDFINILNVNSYRNEKYKKNISTDTVIFQYKQLLHTLGLGNVVNPLPFIRTFIREYKQYTFGHQHDSAEFLESLLNELHNCLSRDISKVIKKPSSEIDKVMYKSFAKDWSKIIELFYGQYTCSTQCTECNYTSFNYDPFLILPLSFDNSSEYPIRNTNTTENTTKKPNINTNTTDNPNGSNPNKNREVTLEDLIEYYISGEILDEEESWNCKKCKKKVTTKRKIRISKSPKNLIIHLKRFNTEIIGNKIYLKKNNTYVDYPETFTKFNSTYKLYSTICHSGNLNSGHYYTFNKINNKWYLFNDSHISQKDLIKESSYLLFYSKV